MDLGELELKPGQNALTVEVIGANPEAVKHYMFGMDYLVVE